jgi:hypothetical protein
MSAAATLRLLADLIDQGHPADVVSVHDGGVTVIVTNPISAARWRESLDAHPEIHDADVRLLQPIGATS